jgi:RNA polymerase sigma-70 factor (ECF subfamily)
MVDSSAAESGQSGYAADHRGQLEALPEARDARLRAALNAHFASVWRTVQALGVPKGSAEDVAQKVFLVLSDKLDQVLPGCERSFLMAAAVRMAANSRRQLQRRAEAPGDGIDAMAHGWPNPEHLFASKQARDLLDEILSSMPSEQREVFLLFELEQLSVTEVAGALGIPRGTVASRLRAARALFEAAVRRLRSREQRQGGQR